MTAHISEGVRLIRRPERAQRAWNIDPSVVSKAKKDEHSREVNPIESVPPGKDFETEVIGIVRELELSVDVYKKLKMPQTSMGEALLGILGSGEWGRVTIHVLESVIYSPELNSEVRQSRS